MKVIVGNGTYLMHWETRKFSLKEGKNTGLELEATDCIIRHVQANGEALEIARGHVSQTACDSGNSVTARRLSFLKAIRPPLARGSLNIPLRKALGHEYNRTCRVTSNTHSRTTRKLKSRIKLLEETLLKIVNMPDKTLKGVIADVKKSEEVQVNV